MIKRKQRERLIFQENPKQKNKIWKHRIYQKENWIKGERIRGSTRKVGSKRLATPTIIGAWTSQLNLIVVHVFQMNVRKIFLIKPDFYQKNLIANKCHALAWKINISVILSSGFYELPGGMWGLKILKTSKKNTYK